MNLIINDLMSGALIMGYFIAALFFQKFYKTTRDRLFAFFATAFWILCVQRVMLALSTRSVEDTVIFYIVRLIAFLIILYAIVDKNRAARRNSLP